MDITKLQRPGSKLLGTDPRELFRTEFTGLVLNAFKKACKFLDKHVLRTIEHGRGARFDAIGEANAFYHTPGTDLSNLGNQIKHDAFDIMVDAKLIAPMYLDEIEEAMSDLSLRQEYAESLGTALARALDSNIGRCAILAARHAARVPDGFGGSVISDPALNSNVELLTKALFDSKVLMDNKSVDPENRYCILQPTYYSMLAQNLNLINNLYSGAGSIAEGEVYKVAGFTLIQSITVPNDVVSNSFNGKYDGDFTKTVAVCMTNKAVGTVQLKGLTTETTWDHNRQATFLAAKFCMGHGVLRPECAVEIRAEAAVEPPPEG